MNFEKYFNVILMSTYFRIFVAHTVQSLLFRYFSACHEADCSKIDQKTGIERLINFFADKEKQKHIREVSAMCLSRPQKLCNFLEWREYKIVYKRYASLFFITCVDRTDNELITLEVIHQFVEVLDRYFGNVVCKLWQMLFDVLTIDAYLFCLSASCSSI
jgi:hypothetical protein